MDLSPQSRAYALAALAVLVYANTLGFGYALDDHMVITHNRFTTEGVRGLPAIFRHDSMAGYYGSDKVPVAGGRYRPLALATHALEYQLVGERPAVSHLVNVLAYAATALLLYQLLALLFPAATGRPWYRDVAFLATALFVVHPVHTEVVANIKGRDDLLSLLFGLAALLCWLRAIDRPASRGRRIVVAVLFLLSLLSKESTISFLAVAPAILWYRTKRSPRAIAAAMAPWIAAGVAYAVMRFAVLGVAHPTIAPQLMNEPFLEATPAQHAATLLLTWGWYLLLLVWPHPLTHDYYPYHVPLVGFSHPLVVCSIAAYAVLAYMLVGGLARRSLPSFCVLWYVATLALYSNLVFGIGTFMNERFLYIPSIGFVLLVAWALVEHVHRPALVMMLTVIVLVAGSAKTFARNLAWRDDVTLALTDVETSRGSARAQMAAGWAHLTLAESTKEPGTRTHELAEAVSHLRRSLAINHGYFAALQFLGSALAQSGEHAQALGYYTAALTMQPANADVLNDIQAVAERATAEHDFETAIKAYETLIAHQPDARFYEPLGRIYGKELGDLTRAQAILEDGLRVDPRNAGLLQKLGIVYAMRGRTDDAIGLFDRAIAIAPQDAGAYVNKAMALRQIGKAAEADEATRKAQQLDPTIAGP